MSNLTSRICIVLVLQFALPCTYGYGGIRRRAWGKVHMLRSGKRSDISPLEDQIKPVQIALAEQKIQDGGGPAEISPDLLQFLTNVLSSENQNLEEDGQEQDDRTEVEPAAGMRTFSRILEVPRPTYQLERQSRSRKGSWGNLHMLRSGRSLPPKRGGLWDYNRPRWGGGHMLRSGRSAASPSMQEVEEMANNENYETRNIE